MLAVPHVMLYPSKTAEHRVKSNYANCTTLEARSTVPSSYRVKEAREQVQ